MSMSPRDMSEFWTILSKLVQKSGWQTYEDRTNKKHLHGQINKQQQLGMILVAPHLTTYLSVLVVLRLFLCVFLIVELSEYYYLKLS